jgi:hypothetical protein
MRHNDNLSTYNSHKSYTPNPPVTWGRPGTKCNVNLVLQRKKGVIFCIPQAQFCEVYPTDAHRHVILTLPG